MSAEEEIADLLREKADITAQEDAVSKDIQEIRDQRTRLAGHPRMTMIVASQRDRVQANRDAMAAMALRKSQIKARLAELRPLHTFELSFMKAAEQMLSPEQYAAVIEQAKLL